MKSRMSPQVRTLMGQAVVAMLIVAADTAWNAWPAEAADDLKPDLSLSAFMRKKLDASSQILEGLTAENAEPTKQGAKTLIELRKVEKWNILSDPEYSLDFRSNAKKRVEATEKDNFDNAALQWFATTKNG
ncbi:MAG: hypothetical protein NTZ32_02915 [Planctomycetales bacterium]|nr:hypothetical protein [Planctomycetales bacterium]